MRTCPLAVQTVNHPQFDRIIKLDATLIQLDSAFETIKVSAREGQWPLDRIADFAEQVAYWAESIVDERQPEAPIDALLRGAGIESTQVRWR